jgi:LysR family transcriptional regulator, glycine cleavage system transcriptional activator
MQYWCAMRSRPLDLPPLNALRTFEAAARHASMTNAAHELGVTQTAVSHQIRLLEDHLAVKLFLRTPGHLELTGPGRAWAAALSDVFGRLHAANRRLRTPTRGERAIISITAIPSFTAGWLVPHLGGFFTQHRDLDVRISPSERIVDLLVEPIDLGIRYGGGRYPGLIVEKLFDDAWLVVCAPSLARRVRRLGDLRRVPRLHDDEPDGWATWLARRGAPDLHLGQGRELTDSAMVVDAAIRGQGVALARWSLAADALAQGRLIQPFRAKPIATGRAYYLVARAATLLRPEVAAFRAWLIAEIASSLRPMS